MGRCRRRKLINKKRNLVLSVYVQHTITNNNMARFDKKPFIMLTCNFEKPFTLFDDGRARHLHRPATITFPTYRDFLKKLKQVSVNGGSWTVTLIRYKRADWGEWFENWRCEDGKLSIINQGWM